MCVYSSKHAFDNNTLQYTERVCNELTYRHKLLTCAYYMSQIKNKKYFDRVMR